ncbi:hypothetical protein [Streptomyces sp. NBC_01716]|uniref:hypothetical protein n=1 Tax=Streptomyces sp. NBC_01716 TaxID=2975917 RepID=UPI002E31729A|nr:hypothetical protein [Streptomyces sp. NBC_01716]
MPEDLPFNEDQFVVDRDAAMYTYQVEYNMGTNEYLMEALKNYYQVLWETGQNLNAGIAADVERSEWAAGGLVDEFNAMRMLDVPAKWFKDNRKYYSNDTHSKYWEDLNEAADKASHRKALWSKTDTKWVLEETKKRGLVALEEIAAAEPQNKRSNGVKKWSDALVTGYLWTGMSTGFVRGARSCVEAFMLEGRTDGSVMANHEVPTLAEMIKKGLVNELHVQIENIDDPSQPPERWTLVDGKTFHVHSVASFGKIPSPGTGFAQRQQIWYEKENRKASIDEFVTAVGDKNVAILLPRRNAIVPGDVDLLKGIKKNERDRLGAARKAHRGLRKMSIQDNDIYRNVEYQQVLRHSVGDKLQLIKAIRDGSIEMRSRSVSAASGPTDQASYAASGSTGRANSVPSGSTDQAYYADSGSTGQAYYADSGSTGQASYPLSGVQFANVAFSEDRRAWPLNHHDTERISPLEGDFADLTVTDEAHAGEAHTAVSGSRGQAYYANLGTGEHRTDERRESSGKNRSYEGYGTKSGKRKKK